MKISVRFLLPVILGIVIPLAGCHKITDGELPPDLLETINAFYAAIEQGDGEARIALFSDDAIMMPNHWTAWRGKDAIAEVVRSGSEAVFKIRDREVIDSHAECGLAYTVNSYSYTFHAVDEPAQWHKTKNVHLWKKDEAGHWKLYLDIWNSDVPLSSFAEE